MVLPPKSALVIGAGPSGLVSYRNLAKYGCFETVALYERRDDVGGVWYLDNPTSSTITPRWPSPSYPGLIGNVLPEYLSFSHYPFPALADPHQPFPTLGETYEFLRSFAEPYICEGKIKLNMEVVRVEEMPDGQGWKVRTKDWNNGQGTEVDEIWDAVVVAVGWYDHPVWPNTPGLDILREHGLATHANSYRGPQGNEGKQVLVVGNANSGNDIAAHLAPIAKTPVYQSIRRPAFPGFPSLPDARIRSIAPVAQYSLTPSNNKITAHLQDGTTLTDIDTIYIATGYKPHPDFIHVLDPTSPTPHITRLVDQNPHPDTSHRVPSLHRHILYAYNPTLAFIGSPMSFTPFTVNDISSLWLTYIWSLSIPLLPSSPSKLLEFETERIKAIETRRKETNNPSALFAYSVLGASEESYAESLRKEIIDIHPELEEYLPKWAPEEERKKHREMMYPRKYDALLYARDHQKKVVVEAA
ncbi:FAD/NAD(P)-binding domain-containing protein [Macrolepiota fuliginosa MF-IS2]|uniref:FAD/NAD(P)-binding domain-containing protein n=1 Tax=Macrolepiota fuliginosa MF-IS2 TaxID=1400762 RepID=A0A9P5XLR6_9AGAR|nr:FAD/NAD(P)-binding domain-containing protein [Macrolepiota fuliginosa MF-IS2]